MAPIPRELVDAFARGNGALFVGAGLSLGAGLPGWADLVRPLAAEIEELPAQSSPEQIAQFFVNEHGRGLLVQRLRRVLDPMDIKPTAVHDALLSLPLQRIYTTNFDRLIERALTERKKTFDRVIRNEDVSLLDAKIVQVVKIHGDLEHADSIVLTTEDYDNYLATKPSISDMLKVDLQSRSVLFLGYSFSDDDLRMILSRVGREGRAVRRNLFSVQFAPSRAALREFERQGIVVIPLDRPATPADATTALASWLEELSAAVRTAAAQGNESSQKKNHNLPVRTGELIGRNRDITRILEGLQSRYPLITIEGFAGVGKTALALEIGYRCATGVESDPGLRFDFVVWVSAKDKPDQKRWLNDVLNVIATTTNFPVITQLPIEELETKKTQVDLLLKSFRILLIVDNFETIVDPELVEWMENIPHPSKVAVTTRNRQLHQKAWAITLEGLDTAEALTLLRQHASSTDLAFVRNASDRSLLPLCEATSGNPQAMRLALGLVAGGSLLELERIVDELRGASHGGSINDIFDTLFAKSWNLLGEPARRVLLVTPLFVGVASIRGDALQAAAGLTESDREFREGLAECERFGLLEPEPDLAEGAAVRTQPRPRRYAIHSMTRSFAHRKLRDQPELERVARRRCTEYFLELVRARARREQPDQPYWNALVTDGMLDLDPEWPSIEQVMTWADDEGDNETLVAFVLLLIHYMDSRFLNRERLLYVRKAITAVRDLGRPRDEALLRIDALGWTYVEEGRLEEAYEEITHGFRLAEALEASDRDDLRALGLAWRARVRIEQGRVEDASRLIGEALSIPCNPWIKCRVYMAAGDIAMKRRQGAEALQFYQQQADEAAKYGDEGHGYQWLPRIGMAHLDLGNLDGAQQAFERLHSFEQIAIGRLYAEYGLAMVAYKRGERMSARAMIDDIRDKLSRRTTSNLLLKLIGQLYTDLEAAQGSVAVETPAVGV